jgi:hypothetical protein
MPKSSASKPERSYAGLDVSLKETAICIVDEVGKIVWERMVPTGPAAIANHLVKHAPGLERGSWQLPPPSPARPPPRLRAARSPTRPRGEGGARARASVARMAPPTPSNARLRATARSCRRCHREVLVALAKGER